MIKVCPNPIPWNNIFKKLSKFANDHENLSKPPVPLILSGWWATSDQCKKDRWEETVYWAKISGCPEITDALAEEDFYFCDQITTTIPYSYGDNWNYKAREKPSEEKLQEAILRLKSEWKDIAGEIADATHPIRFTGAKARRLQVKVVKDVKPPWGDWDRLSDFEEKRRTFTILRQKINNTLNTHEVDHIGFK